MEETETIDPQEVTNTNPTNSSFQRQLDELVVGRRVRVEARDGKRFEGNLVAICVDDWDVLLRDVEELPGGATAPAASVAEVDWIVPVGESE